MNWHSGLNGGLTNIFIPYIPHAPCRLTSAVRQSARGASQATGKCVVTTYAGQVSPIITSVKSHAHRLKRRSCTDPWLWQLQSAAGAGKQEGRLRAGQRGTKPDPATSPLWRGNTARLTLNSLQTPNLQNRSTLPYPPSWFRTIFCNFCSHISSCWKPPSNPHVGKVRPVGARRQDHAEFGYVTLY